ncbi:MAG: HAMP domain-containing protein [Candidatus Bathyarchaeota archaeon]|nr:HAMP domain-containing protein [Candidatus Bathyarchaeota archaeon]
MKIKGKMLLSYMLIVALFVGIGVAVTLNTMKMSDIQANVNKQVEIGNYATAYQKGFTLRSQGLGEVTTDPENAITDTQTGQALTAATSEYLISTLPKDSQLYSVFDSCYQIDTNTITPAVNKVIEAYQTQNTAEVAAQMQVVNDATREINANLDNFQLLVIENVQAATAESQSYANFSVILSAVGISTIAVVSIAMALVMGKRITDPLKKLTDIAGKVSMGELEHEIKINTKDEISDLGEAFQRMINAFKMTSAMSQTEE